MASKSNSCSKKRNPEIESKKTESVGSGSGGIGTGSGTTGSSSGGTATGRKGRHNVETLYIYILYFLIL